MNSIAQIFGALALFVLCFSYQKKSKKDFLFLQIIANIFYGMQYFFLHAISALMSNIMSIARSILFYDYERKDKQIPLILLIIFEIIIIVLGVFVYTDFYSIIPIFIACLYTYGTWQKKLKITYIVGVISAILWILYNIAVGAYVAILGSILELVFSFIGLIKIIKLNK